VIAAPDVPMPQKKVKNGIDILFKHIHSYFAYFTGHDVLLQIKICCCEEHNILQIYYIQSGTIFPCILLNVYHIKKVKVKGKGNLVPVL
jgi:hypothetical protein